MSDYSKEGKNNAILHNAIQVVNIHGGSGRIDKSPNTREEGGKNQLVICPRYFLYKGKTCNKK